MKIRIGVGTCLLLACGGGSGQSARPDGETGAAEDRALADVEPLEVAGGETSEFSGGDISYCPEVKSSEPIALTDAELAPWVAIVAGHHELTLGWQLEFLSDAVRGFEEHTTVSIDVTVLGARERVYGDNGYGGDAFEACRGRRSRQLELDIQIETADGALATSVREWYEPLNDEGVTILERIRLDPDVVIRSSDFSGSLELGLEHATPSTPQVGVGVSFGTDSMFGGLVPFIPSPDGLGSSWYPISAEFPDDGCAGRDTPLGLDDRIESLSVTPRLAFERVAAFYAAESPIPAVWEAPIYLPVPVEIEVPPPTQVEVSLGEPTHACRSTDIAIVYAPLTILSADGRVNLTQSVGLALYRDTRAGGSIESPWVPAAEFADRFGLSGIPIRPGAVASIALATNLNLEGEGVEGYLSVSEWKGFSEDLAAAPEFRWCRGTICSPIPAAP